MLGSESLSSGPEAFIPPGSPYLGQAVPGNPPPEQRFSPEPENTVTKPASAAATLASSCPSLFSDSGTLAQDLVEAFLECPQRDRAPRRPLEPGRSTGPVDAGCKSGEMASRPYHLVLRAVPAWRALSGISALSPGLRLSVQFLLRQRRTAPRPPPARPSDPPGRRRGHGLPPPCRCGRGQVLPDRATGDPGGIAAPGESGSEP